MESTFYENLNSYFCFEDRIHDANKLAVVLEKIPEEKQQMFNDSLLHVVIHSLDDLTKIASWFTDKPIVEQPDIAKGNSKSKALKELIDKMNNIIGDIRKVIQDAPEAETHKLDLSAIDYKYGIDLEFNDVVLDTVMESLEETGIQLYAYDIRDSILIIECEAQELETDQQQGIQHPEMNM